MAGTAVLGTRLAIADYHAAAAALLAVAGVCWALLVVPVLRHWKTPTAGISFVLTAATEALAALAAILAVSYRAGWLVTAATATMALGLAFYVFTAARFDLRQLVTGHGDHWLAGGAPAIAALAAGNIAQSAIEPAAPCPHHQHAGAVVPGHGLAPPAGRRRDPQLG